MNASRLRNGGSKIRVVDTWAILEWIKGRVPGGLSFMQRLLEASEGEASLVMSAINVGEVYYFLHKDGLGELAEEWRTAALGIPIRFEVPDFNDVWHAASLKAQFRISYADSFAAALAQKLSCPLITGDAELRSVTGLELDWIGA